LTFNDADASADSILTGGTLPFGVAAAITTHTHAGIASVIAGSATLTKTENRDKSGLSQARKAAMIFASESTLPDARLGDGG
jgi:hypothetical protein